MQPFPEQHELLSLFESEPLLDDPEIPWRYNRLRFSRAVGGYVVECEIEPGYETLRLRCTHDSAEVFALHLYWIAGLEVESVGGSESLIAHFSESTGLDRLRLQLTPTVHLAWGTRRELPRQV